VHFDEFHCFLWTNSGRIHDMEASRYDHGLTERMFVAVLLAWVEVASLSSFQFRNRKFEGMVQAVF
jgi:hypothetical protein